MLGWLLSCVGGFGWSSVSSLFPVLYFYGMWYVKILKSIAKAASL